MVLSLARTSFPVDMNAVEDLQEKNLIDNDSIPSNLRLKKTLNYFYHFTPEDRRKKFLRESTNFQGGQSLQGLWLMPGRR